MGTTLAWILLVLGAGIAVYGLVERAREVPADDDDPEQYLRSLEADRVDADEFDLLLDQPLLSRVVPPIAGPVLELPGGLPPPTHPHPAHHRPPTPALPGPIPPHAP